MFDAKALLDQVLGGTPASGGGKSSQGGLSPDFVKGLAGGGLAGSLATILLGSKSGKKLAKSALTVGGTAALAGLAYKAYQTWQQNQQQAQSPARTPEPVFLPGAPAAQADLGLALLRAMIAAAKADGHIDAAEQQKIFAKLDEAGLGTEAKAFIIDEMRKPLNLDSVVADATTQERAIEIYAASVLAIDADDPAEQAYLAMLAARLKLDPGLKLAVEQEAARATVS